MPANWLSQGNAADHDSLDRRRFIDWRWQNPPKPNGPILMHTIALTMMFWLPPMLKLILTAFTVVAASVVVERAGPVLGALVVTLPVTMWPAYLFLLQDHDADYLVASGQVGLAVNAASAPFMLLYLRLAQQRGPILSLSVAIGSWIVLALLLRSHDYTLLGAGLLNLAAYPLCIVLSRRFSKVRVQPVVRQWYELPLRTALVCALMGTVLVLSHLGGPGAAGMIAVYPISTTSTMLLLHTRIGGRASAAVIANGLWGLFGVGIGLFMMTLTAPRWGGTVGLAVLLAVPVTWNWSVWIIRARQLGCSREKKSMALEPQMPASGE
jgi:hypothetical protein